MPACSRDGLDALRAARPGSARSGRACAASTAPRRASSRRRDARRPSASAASVFAAGDQPLVLFVLAFHSVSFLSYAHQRLRPARRRRREHGCGCAPSIASCSSLGPSPCTRLSASNRSSSVKKPLAIGRLREQAGSVAIACSGVVAHDDSCSPRIAPRLVARQVGQRRPHSRAAVPASAPGAKAAALALARQQEGDARQAPRHSRLGRWPASARLTTEARAASAAALGRARLGADDRGAKRLP